MFSEPKTDLKRIEEECLEEATLIIKKTTTNAETSEKLLNIAEPKITSETALTTKKAEELTPEAVLAIDNSKKYYAPYLDSAKAFINNPYVQNGAYFAGCAMVSIYSGPLLAMATRTAFPAIIYPAMTGSAMPSAYSFSYWLVAAPLREQVCANVCLIAV